MAEESQNVEKGAAPKTGAASKLSLLVAFIAGAFAAWIIISNNIF